jgi:glycosyltransferase involved in cell wall biosynthesis
MPFGLPQPPATHAQLPAGVSLCMIVKNEERFLRACLESVRGLVDEICIVDTGSTDQTLAIAAEFGARLEHRAWRNDFSWARNEALAMARHRWIIVLDADEVVREESHATLRRLREVPAYDTGLWVRCFNAVDDYKGTGASSHAIARVFPNNPRIRYRSPIHEYITLDGGDSGIPAKHAPLAIDHFGYLKAVVSERKKADRNLAIIRAAIEREPEDPFHWYNLGTTALIERRMEEGITALERMRVLVGTTARGFVPSGLSFLADAYVEFRGDADRAIELARLSLERSPHFANAHFTLGKALAHAGRYHEAIAAFEAAIADGAHNKQQFLVDDEVSVWKAQSEIGAAYGRLGDKESALAWFERGLANRPGVLPLMLNRARALESLGRLEETEEQYRRAWEEFADDQTAMDYVNVLLRRHAYDRSLAAIDAIAERVSPRCGALMLMTAATIAQRAGCPERSPVYAQRALALAPGAAPVLDAAEAYFRAHGDEAALKALRAVELEAPLEAVEDYARRSSRWLLEHEPARALAVASEGRERFGDHPGIIYDAAAATIQLGDREAGLRLLAAVSVENAEVHARADFLRSAVLADLGRFEDALAAIARVIQRSPASVEAVLHQVKLLDLAGRRADVEIALRRGFDATRDQRIAVQLATLLMTAGRYHEARAISEAALANAG